MAYSRTTWVDYPATTTPITAARMNNIETGILAIEAGQGAITNGIYTNEAARDAAIVSPTEGMRVYLTSPTVPAATGTTAILPTGITTIYNGSVWVCVTDVASDSLTTSTLTGFAYTSTFTGADTTANSVTLVTGTTAILLMTVNAFPSGGGALSLALSASVSGASTIAAADTHCVGTALTTTNTVQVTIGGSVLMTGLTPGTNTFTLNGKISAGNLPLYRRFIGVRGIA